MKERAVVFGAHGGLVGVVTEPNESSAGTRRAVLFSNVGMHHRVGPFRLYVELARHLAARGLHVMRFDLSGMGDSEPRPGGLSDAECARLDLVDAMDWMSSRYGIDDFMLLGLCSGVDSTHAVAVADPRVTGAVFIDGYTYPTTGYRLRRHIVRYFQAGRWASYARRARRERAVSSASNAVDAVEETVFTRELPSLERFRQDIRTLASRGTRMLFIYSGSVDYRYNGEGQLYEQLGERPDRAVIEIGYLRASDHLFTTEVSRRTLFATIDRWLDADARPRLTMDRTPGTSLADPPRTETVAS